MYTCVYVCSSQTIQGLLFRMRKKARKIYTYKYTTGVHKIKIFKQ